MPRAEIFADMRRHIEYDKGRIDKRQLEELAEEARKRVERPSILDALKDVKDRVPLIAEFKPASPAKIFHFYYNLDLAVSQMIEGGAAAISILTEPVYYRGSLHYLYETSKKFDVPFLRKDLILEDFQIYETAATGASSYLLIVDQFEDDGGLEDLIQLGRSFSMEPLVEVNSVEDARRVARTSAKLVGINNGEGVDRDLNKTRVLAKEVSADFLVSESGIKSAEDVRFVMQYADGVLVGTAISESGNVKAKVEELCLKNLVKR
ncbi:MAG: indole-3-glycerol-phosphate synthase [Thaumarchaeota archaeon]|nr:indole-3-glycerol-phosphate synthase [Nitrososphaerota archaeon]